MRNPRTASKLDRRWGIWALVAAAITVSLLAGGFVGGSQAQGLLTPPEPKFTGEGPEVCLTCHSGREMLLIADTPHGNAGNPHAPYGQESCESCHGPGSFHVSAARGGVGFPPLNDFRFSDRPEEGRFDTCLGCHAESVGDRPGIGWVGSTHDQIGMTCASCHNIHEAGNQIAKTAPQRALCASCHGSENSKHERFVRSGMRMDRLKCTACHDPHGLK